MSEEKIIDGVNVAGCEHYTTMEDCDGIHDLCEQLDDYCSTKKNCYYKQLKRLEKENEKLKSELSETFGAIDNVRMAKETLQKENEELKKKNSELEYSITFGNYDLVRDKNLECKDLKKENKRLAEIVKDLAKKNQKYENNINIKVLQKELDEVSKRNRYYLDCLYKLENALEEIRNILTAMCMGCKFALCEENLEHDLQTMACQLIKTTINKVLESEER